MSLKFKFYSLYILFVSQLAVGQGIVQTSGSYIQTSGNSNIIVVDASLQLNANSKLTIQPSGAVVVSNNITNNAGTSGILIKAAADQPNGTLIFHNSVNNPVSATVEMYSKASINLNNAANNRYKWQFFGIPVRTINAAPTLNGAYVRRWSEPDQNWMRVYNETEMTAFEGYEISQTGPKIYTFSGSLENGNLSATLFASGTIDALTNSYGYHLFANPYTAAIQIADLELGTGTDATVYLFNTGTQLDYETNNSSFGSGPGQYLSVPILQAGIDGLPTQIPSMQAFFTRATSTTNNTLQINYPGSVEKNTTLQRAPSASQSAQYKPYTIVDVIGEKYGDQLWITIDENSTTAFDLGLDGMKMMGSDSVPQIYALVNNQQYQVYSVNQFQETNLGFRAGKDTDYQFTFRHKNHETLNQKLWLMDLQLNIQKEITDSGSVYAFSTLPGETLDNRFRIVTEENQINGFETQLSSLIRYSWPDETLSIVNSTSDVAIAQIMDVSGKTLLQMDLPAGQTSTRNFNLPSGIYLLHIQSGNKNISYKILK